ncbi:hypothetical protein Pan97_00540 [Bremerella volcania]|uniref:Carboxypeptidase regulatory-like domain-containing protein n=1 Tax=Bremerella volcania TaxID=2527984 RepID=A0A518C1J0_9BACT|nr:carboxypeptidase regulatory-like domain-containing protein [Bremerella volcania]QDU73087.1 hypothetical protein Pan97_00540 [Bremerella volcania]
MTIQRALAATTLFAMVILIGCSDSGPALEGVTGTITKNGVPFVGAQLEFYPEGPGAASYGKSDEQGNFRLRYSTGKPGAVIGNHKVTVIGGSTNGAEVEEEPVEDPIEGETKLAPVSNPDAAGRRGRNDGGPKSIEGIPAVVKEGEKNHVIIELD